MKFWGAILLTALFSMPAMAVVKLSKNGICHTPQSPWYSRTKNYTPFEDMQSCLNAGGRLPQEVSAGAAAPLHAMPLQQSLPVAGKYSRAQFGTGWDDADGDCQDSRAEALIQASTVTPRMSGCRVVSGRWISPYTGNVIMNAKEIDIDHVYPLALSWVHGAAQWSSKQREKFANDPVNLLPVEASLNRAKGAKPPSQWLPPSGQCQYVSRFKRISLIYKLNLPQSEREWIDRFLTRC